MAIRPARGRVSSPYGMRRHPITGVNAMHTGEDIGYTGGTTLYAPVACVVASYGPAGGYGNMMKLRSGSTEIWLAHMSRSIAPVGKSVPLGEAVGIMGATGNVTGVHVHWEVRVNGVRVDPAKWLAEQNATTPSRNRFYPTIGEYKAIQQRYQRLGYNLGAAGADGIEGPWMRENVVKPFQRKHGLVSDGVHGPKTNAKQLALLAPPAVAPVPAPPFPLKPGYFFGPRSGPVYSVSGFFSHREDLRRWQQQMRNRGWSIQVDGLWGTNTSNVVYAFQKQKGLKADRKIGPATWAAAWTSPIS